MPPTAVWTAGDPSETRIGRPVKRAQVVEHLEHRARDLPQDVDEQVGVDAYSNVGIENFKFGSQTISAAPKPALRSSAALMANFAVSAASTSDGELYAACLVTGCFAQEMQSTLNVSQTTYRPMMSRSLLLSMTKPLLCRLSGTAADALVPWAGLDCPRPSPHASVSLHRSF